MMPSERPLWFGPPLPGVGSNARPCAWHAAAALAVARLTFIVAAERCCHVISRLEYQTRPRESKRQVSEAESWTRMIHPALAFQEHALSVSVVVGGCDRDSP